MISPGSTTTRFSRILPPLRLLPLAADSNKRVLLRHPFAQQDPALGAKPILRKLRKAIVLKTTLRRG
jgi:hypothetical protein